MNANTNSTILIIVSILGILSAASVIRFLSKTRDVPVGMKRRLILRRVSLILLLASGTVAFVATRGSLWERGASNSMLFFAFVYLAFPFYSLARLLANGIRGRMEVRKPGPQ